MSTPFQAMVIDNEAGKADGRRSKTLKLSGLAGQRRPGRGIAYSGLNYKDGLAVSGRAKKIARKSASHRRH